MELSPRAALQILFLCNPFFGGGVPPILGFGVLMAYGIGYVISLGVAFGTVYAIAWIHHWAYQRVRTRGRRQDLYQDMVDAYAKIEQTSHTLDLSLIHI